MNKQEKLRAAGLVAAVAGLVGGAADILLLSTPGFASDSFAVRQLPDWRITAGTLLAIAVIPFLSLGYWALSRYLTGASDWLRTAVFLGGIYGAGLGNAIHGTVGTLVQAVQGMGVTAQDSTFIGTYARLVIPQYALFYLLLTIGTLVLGVIIWQEKSVLPRWFVVLLPLWSNALVLPLGQLVPALGELLYPSIANLSHAVMFGVMTAVAWDIGDSLDREAGHPSP